MANTVKIEVTSAFLVEGEIARPGSQVSLPRAEALALVARGKAALTEGGEATAQAEEDPEAEGEEVPEDGAAPVGTPRGRGRRSQG